MIKILFAFASALLFSQISLAQYYENEKILSGLKGDVETITSEDAKIVLEGGKYIEKERYLRRTETYNLQGNLIKEEPISGRESRSIVCLISKCITEESKQGYKYNKQGKVIEKSSVLLDGTVISKSEMEYNAQGTLLETRYYSRDNEGNLYLQNKRVYKFRGNQKTSVYYEGCCKVKHWQIAVVNSRKDVIQSSFFRPDGYERKAVYSYEYDSARNWTKRKVFDWVTKNRKSFFEPVETNYRKISYYDITVSNPAQN